MAKALQPYPSQPLTWNSTVRGQWSSRESHKGKLGFGLFRSTLIGGIDSFVSFLSVSWSEDPNPQSRTAVLLRFEVGVSEEWNNSFGIKYTTP